LSRFVLDTILFIQYLQSRIAFTQFVHRTKAWFCSWTKNNSLSNQLYVL